MASHPANIEVWYDDAWHSIPVRDDPGITITRNMQAEIVTSRLTCTIDDTDGHYNPRNPASPLFGKIGKNTPIRATIDGQQRFDGVVSSWRPRRTPEWRPGTGRGDAWVEIQAAGDSRRLGQGTPPALSALRRAIPLSSPLAYWPCEDGGDAQWAVSAIRGHAPIDVTGVAQFASIQVTTAGGNAAVGSYPLPDLSAGGKLTATIPADATAACTTAGQWAVQCLTDVQDTAFGGEVNVLEINTPGGSPFVKWRLVAFFVNGTKNWNIRAYDSADTPTHVNGIGGGDFGSIRLTLRQVGGNIEVTIYLGDSTPLGPATVAGTLAGPAQIVANSNAAVMNKPFPFGHLVLWPTVTPGLLMIGEGRDSYGDPIWVADLNPWMLEPAHDRMARICAEEGIAFTCPAVPEEFATRMGPQPAKTILDLLRECARADDGLLIEPRTARGFAYRPRHSLYAQTPKLVLDQSIPNRVGVPLQPVLDDADTRNDVTVARAGGSSARAVDEASVAVHGRTQTRIEISLADDTRLEDHTSWHLAKGTVDATRYESVTFDFDANPTLATDAAAVDIGDVIELRNTEEGGALVLVDGYTERATGKLRTITFSGPPADVYNAGRYGQSRYDTQGAALVTAVDSDDTALDVVTLAGSTWTTDSAQYPFDLALGGERVTATGAAPLVTDAFGRTEMASWGTSTSGLPWSNASGPDGDFSVSDGRGRHSVSSTNLARISLIAANIVDFDQTVLIVQTVTATGGFISRGLLWRNTDLLFYRLEARFDTDGSVDLVMQKVIPGSSPIIASLNNVETYSPTRTQFRLRFRRRGDLLQGKLWHIGSSEPAGWMLEARDSEITGTGSVGVRSFLQSTVTNPLPVVCEYDAYELTNPQRLTVVRAVNGVVRSWDAGTPVRLWSPARYAL